MAQPLRCKHEIPVRHQLDVFVTCAVLAAAATVLSSCQSGANSSANRQPGKTASTSPAASQPEPGSFSWAVKNPDELDAWAKAAEDEDRQRRADAVKRLTLQQIATLVERLKDPKFREKPPPKERWDDRSALESILDRLENDAPVSMVPAVSDLMGHESDEVRKDVALALGNVAHEDCLPALAKALRDKDCYVRNSALMGIGRGLDAGRGTPAFKAAVFDLVVPEVDREDNDTGGEAPGLLLRLDREKGLRVLLSERFLTVTNYRLYEVLNALNQAGVRVPPDKVEPLLKSLKSRWTEYPHDYAYVACLKSLALSRAPQAETLAREAMDAKEFSEFAGAAEALVMANGFPDGLWSWLSEQLEKNGFEQLPQAQRNCILVLEVDTEVDNGGFSQYFFNSAGNYAGEAVEAFRAIGDRYSAGLLTKANALFGPKGPSANRTERMSQLSKFSPEQEKTLNDLDGLFHENADRWECRMADYALKHRAEFSAATSRPAN